MEGQLCALDSNDQGLQECRVVVRVNRRTEKRYEWGRGEELGPILFSYSARVKMQSIDGVLSGRKEKIRGWLHIEESWVIIICLSFTSITHLTLRMCHAFIIPANLALPFPSLSPESLDFTITSYHIFQNCYQSLLLPRTCPLACPLVFSLNNITRNLKVFLMLLYPLEVHLSQSLVIVSFSYEGFKDEDG